MWFLLLVFLFCAMGIIHPWREWMHLILIVARHADTTFEAPCYTIAACIAVATRAHCCKSTIPSRHISGMMACITCITCITWTRWDRRLWAQSTQSTSCIRDLRQDKPPPGRFLQIFPIGCCEGRSNFGWIQRRPRVAIFQD